MRLAVIRQRYTPFGGAERFVEGALEALLERGVAISLYTREWPETRLALIEPHMAEHERIGGSRAQRRLIELTLAAARKLN